MDEEPRRVSYYLLIIVYLFLPQMFWPVVRMPYKVTAYLSCHHAWFEASMSIRSWGGCKTL